VTVSGGAGWRVEARRAVEAELAKHVKVGPGPEHEFRCSYCHNGFGYGRWPCAIVRALEPIATDLGRALDALDAVLALPTADECMDGWCERPIGGVGRDADAYKAGWDACREAVARVVRAIEGEPQ
jgi:hypothetical protein